MLNFKPLGNRVVVKVIDKSNETTASGLIIPEASKEKPLEGEVVAIGTLQEDIKVGDKVLYGKFSATDLKLDGITYLIMTEDDILGVL